MARTAGMAGMAAAGGTLRSGSGARIVLGDRLGGGGEGAVYEVSGRPDCVAKIYREPLPPERRLKLEAMIAAAPPSLVEITAWPSELLYAGGGAVGFLMPRAMQAEEAHVLYGPKSRKQKFPHAGYKFLVHAAMNLARAFAVVHRNGVVIGDVNERVAMVAQNGTVRLIDCDSFQLRSGGRTFRCEVGVPLFTPPELQNVPTLRGIERTEQHDLFGLAVLIFHLLFLGRHPFSGRNSDRPDMTIEAAIREHRFAYSVDGRRTGMSAPANVPPLQSAGADIARLFELAFAPAAATGAARRPSAAQWADVLQALLATLVTCANNGAHAYASSLSACPWCAIEVASGIELFNYVEPTGSPGPPLDVEAVWRAIEAMPVLARPPPMPDPEVIRSQLAPSADARLLAAFRGELARVEQAAAAREAAELEVEDQKRSVQAAEAAVAEARAFLATYDDETARLPEVERCHGQAKAELRRCLKAQYLCGLLLLAAAAGWLAFGKPWLGGVIVALAGAGLKVAWMLRLKKGSTERSLARELAGLQGSLRRGVGQRREQLRRAEQAVSDARQALMAAQGRVYTALLAETEAKAQATVEQADAAAARVAIKARHRAAAARFDEAVTRHHAFQAELHRLRPQLLVRKDEVLALCKELRKIEARHKAGHRKARAEARDAQLADYLDRFFIMHETWPRQLPKSVLASLSSYGIETAADITDDAVSKVPGFGPVRTQLLLDWRHRKAAGFRVDTSHTEHAAKLQAVDRRMEAERRAQERLLRKASARLEALAAGPAQRLALIVQDLEDSARVLAQALVDTEAASASSGPAAGDVRSRGTLPPRRTPTLP